MDDFARNKQNLCDPLAKALDKAAIRRAFEALEEGWKVVDGHHLSKTWTFPDFAAGLSFVNKLGRVCDLADHHPDVFLRWGSVRVDVWTHTVNGLAPGDFALARRLDDIEL